MFNGGFAAAFRNRDRQSMAGWSPRRQNCGC